MTSTAADLINAQIAQELDKLNNFMTFESEKPAILDRISTLTAMLPTNPQPTPSRKEIVTEVCEQIILEARKESGQSLREICAAIVARA